MTMTLEGSCKCGAVRFRAQTHTPYPYQLCYCSICRKTAGGGGFAINLMADAATLAVEDPEDSKRIVHAPMTDARGHAHASSAERHFCGRCGSALWLFSPEWPALVHPHASAIDSELPRPVERTHILLGSKASWVEPEFRPGDLRFDGYPEESIEEWHRSRGLWID